MRKFIGTKVVLATSMTRGDYNHYRGWDIPADENPEDAGYLVEYTDGGKANHPDHKGYISWSPADVFERAYEATSGNSFDFGVVVAGLKAGYRFTRKGWNGANQFIYLVGEGRYPAATHAGQMIANGQPDGLVPYRPYVALRTAQGDVVPWAASQSDMLASDWEVFD
jgi:hypothetical protein